MRSRAAAAAAAENPRQVRQLALLEEEIQSVERKLDYLTKHRPIGKDGLFVSIADRDKGLLLIAMRGKLIELRDSLTYNGALS